jgi:hypothetical protein
VTPFRSTARVAAVLACAAMAVSPALAARTKPKPSVPITLPLSALPDEASGGAGG